MAKTLAVVVTLVLALCAGCSDSGPRLMFAADPSISAGLRSSNMTVGKPLSFGAIMLCMSAPGSATITKVTIHDVQGDVAVVAFAVRLNPMAVGREGLGALDIGLAEYGSGFDPAGTQTVQGACPKNLLAATNEEAAKTSELGVEVRLASGEAGGGSALDLTYTVDGRERIVTVPFAILLCAAVCPADVGSSPVPSG
jgi:hypothetical protein